ncbi:2-dehydropantoate 2-reductase [Bowmanella denitrificans]|uniref:2-dehydropantoate 2-reductase n=1 Tax=Bowmanella denitrificans TaxID=366582 RepID=UPI000C9AEDB7|nr:2-dehydropantoate 2-reductase [Bowmanella denitrificans]
MQHVVFGAGLIGGYLGGVLTHLEQDTRLIGRDSTMSRWQPGLRLSDYQGHQAGPLKLQIQGSDWRETAVPCDVLWLTVKCTHLAQTAVDIAPLVGEKTVILCCQNGIGSDALIKAIFPRNQVLRVMVPFNVVETVPGCLHRGSEGKLTLESDASGLVRALVSLLDCDLMPIDCTSAMTPLQWAKLQLNLGNAVNALADIPVKSMLEQRGYRLVLAALMDELLTLCKVKGIKLPRLTRVPASWLPLVLRLPDGLFSRLARQMLAIDPQVRTSMWWDLSQGKDTEIAYLNGAVIEQALSLGLDCRVNQAIVALVHQAEQGRLKPGLSATKLMERAGIIH